MVIKKFGVLLDLTKVVITRGWFRIVLLVIVSIYYHSRLHPESLDLFTLRGVDCGQPQQILLEVRSDFRVRPAYSERSALRRAEAE